MQSQDVLAQDAAVHGATNSGRRDTSAKDIDRLGVLWRGKYILLLSGVVVGAAVYAATNAVPATYSSSATVSVTAASTPGGSAEDVALASNDVAAQDAQLVTTLGVLQIAASQLHVSTSELAGHVTAGTVASQNLIQITAQSRIPSQATQWVSAVAAGLDTYLVQQGKTTSSALARAVTLEAAPLDQQIAALETKISTAKGLTPGSGALVRLQSEEGQLTVLLASRGTLTEDTALAVASQQPNISVLEASSAPSKVSPRPRLYGGVAALAGLLVSGEILLTVARRRSRDVSL